MSNFTNPLTFRLLKFLYRETAGSKLRVVGMSVVSGLSRGALLAIFNAGAAAAAAANNNIAPLIGAFIVALAIYLASTFDSVRSAQVAVQTMIERLRLRLCTKLLHTQLRFLERQGTGELYTQLSHDLNQLAGATTTFLGVFQAFILVGFALAYLAWLSPLALLAAVVVIAVGTGAAYVQDRKARKHLQKARRLQKQFFDGINDLLQGFKELKLSRARQAGLMEHLDETATSYRDLTIKTETLFLGSFLSSQAFTFLMIAVLVFGMPILAPEHGVMVFQFLATVLFLVGPFETLSRAVPTAARARVALDSVERLEANLNEGISLEEHRSTASPPLNFHDIEFKGTEFAFSGEHDDEHFDVGPLDLKLKRNEIVFVVGGNGAGKTTFLKLLSGLYEPTEGAILVDGREITSPQRQAYREMFAAVFSDFHLFKRLYGVDVSDPALMEALLSELEIGHKTRLHNGMMTTVNLSAGQRKRLAYAISRLANRQVYVFDEFAADQDPQFRRYFYTELLPRLKADGKTIIAVTHDDRWFGVADRVVKMEYGRIAEIDEHVHPAHEPA